MKTLFIVRHAKAEKIAPNSSDFERPLAKRGLSDAATMAERLHQQGIIPDCIISSPANRAKNTALIFAEIIKYPNNNIIWEQAIYEAWTDDLVNILKNTDNSYQSVMIFGHNPAFSTLVTLLSTEEIEGLPTAGIAQIEFKNLDQWAELKAGSGKLVVLDFPKNPEY